MIKIIRQFTVCAFLIVAFTNLSIIQAQDRVTVDRTIKFPLGKISASINHRIQRGTTHVYRVRAREGQQMAVVLKTGNRTSFTISARRAEILDGADGVKQTLVELPETGEYEIQIGTDVTANYTLEVTIK